VGIPLTQEDISSSASATETEEEGVKERVKVRVSASSSTKMTICHFTLNKMMNTYMQIFYNELVEQIQERFMKSFISD